MNAVLKKRLVGAGVLILFAAIVWPLLFDFESRNRDRLDQEWQAQSEDIDQEMSALKDETARVKANLLGKKAISDEEMSADESPHSAADQASLLEKPLVKEPLIEHPKLAIPNSPEDLSKGSSDRARQADRSATLDANKLPISWVVQVATFSQWDNAESLLQSMLKNGEKAYLRPNRANSPPPYVLAVGPFFNKADAEETGAAVAKRYKTGDPIIRRFKSGQ